jgi:hypothetical protein
MHAYIHTVALQRQAAAQMLWMSWFDNPVPVLTHLRAVEQHQRRGK